MRTMVIIFILSFATVYLVNAQQIPTLSQYMENPYLANPAVAGSVSTNPFALHYKKWWSGFNEAPTMQTITGHTALSNSVGVGGKIFNFSTGPISKLGVEGTYAYHFNVGSSSKISLGLSAQLYQFYINKSLLKLEDQDDQTVIFSSDRLIVPDAAFGAYFYDENYYAGISVYQLFNRKVHLMNNNYLDNRQLRHYFVIAGYRYDMNDVFAIEPSILAKFIETGIGQLDANIRFWYNKFLWLGFSYRTNESVVINAGIKRERFAFGYAYDLPLTDIKKYNVGSHELYFALFFGKSKSKLTP